MDNREQLKVFWSYGLASLIMLFLTGLFWTLIPFIMVLRLADADPSVKTRLEQVATYQLDPVDIDPDDPALARRREALAPVFAKLNWFFVALLTSALSFSCLGFFCGWSCGDAAWAGALPLVALLTQRSPAVMPNVMAQTGFTGIELQLWQQVVVVVVQLVVVYAAAIWGANLHARRAASVDDLEGS